MLTRYQTNVGIQVEVNKQVIDYDTGIDFLLERLDKAQGALFTSSFEYPGRYTCWDVGFIHPPLSICSKDNHVFLKALNLRGEVLLSIIRLQLKSLAGLELRFDTVSQLTFEVKPDEHFFSEELRSKQPSVFTIIRFLINVFYSEQEHDLGLYGAYAYDLIFQFEKLNKAQSRADDSYDMVLYLPDELYIVDHRKEHAFCKRYEFCFSNYSTNNLVRDGVLKQTTTKKSGTASCDHHVGQYAQTVLNAKEKFKKGDLFEVVPSQTFYEPCDELPSELFKKLRKANPAPYGFCIHLGDEHLIGASPEMYVRVQGKRVETCPISGTIKRGQTAIEDAKQIEALLSSDKECAELTMCTDVDRNDKSRICQPGSVKVIGRRQIEIYSRLIHTVDHVEGLLADGYDAVDAFLSHMWVVTVTGAPKLWAMQFIEDNELTPRRWYAGAVGWFGFDGNLNTGLTLRTIRYANGMAEVRAGATLLYDSEPAAEEAETRLKGSALLDVIKGKPAPRYNSYQAKPVGSGKKVLLIDHDDSFVHTLANYFRQTGAEVITFRHGFKLTEFDNAHYDLVVLSPGPGCPDDFNLKVVIDKILKKQLPIFGVCLGLQALIEYFGGKLSQLTVPVHGRPANINVLQGKLFESLPKNFTAGRYHSLYADKQTFPKALTVTAETDEGIVMAIEAADKAIYAVQFHPETILSTEQEIGIRLIERVMCLI